MRPHWRRSDTALPARQSLCAKHTRRGLLTTPYCSRPDHLKLLVAAGADVLVLHMGLTGRESDHSMVITPLERCAERINALSQLAKELDPHVIVLCHGGPIVSTVEMRYLMQRCPRLAGFTAHPPSSASRWSRR